MCMSGSFSIGPWQDLHIEVAHALQAVRDSWGLEDARLVGYVFQSYCWLELWQETVGTAERVQPLPLRIADAAGQTLLFLPLGIRPAPLWRTLEFLGANVSDYDAPRIDAGFASACNAASFARLWSMILSQLPRVDIVAFRRMPETIEGLPNPIVTLRHAVHVQDAYAATPLPVRYEAFLDLHRSNVFRDLARKRRKLAAIGPVTFEVLDDPHDILRTLEITLALKRRRYPGSWLHPPKEAFYRQMVLSHLDCGRPHVSRLRVGETVVATHVGAIYGKRFYWLVPGTEEGEWSRFSVGRQLQEQIVRWCIAERLDTFDMTWGDEEYKRFWTDQILPLYACTYAVTAQGSMVLAAREVLKRARRHKLLRAAARRVHMCRAE